MIATKLGHYEITAHLGSGGMGEVYRAHDTRLGRDVALKILPDAFAMDADRLARFRREAHVLASLNHPNIAHIYGVEDAGSTTALVMELVAGPTLAERIASGPLPLDEALVIARQIAQALDAAHERGVIHRDLKPANIKLDEDGAVKVLDFGLAKAIDPSMTGDISNSPTITSPAMTARGVILGTAGYMSPEQAKGRTADKRADIFGFGVVLYEMVVGRRPFQGDTVAELMAAVIKDEPSFERVPERLRPLVQRCLEKDPKKRVRDIGDVWFLLNDQHAIASMAPPRRLLPWAVAVTSLVVALGAAAVAWRADRTPAASAAGAVKFAVNAPPGTLFAPPSMASISPDGSWLLFGAVGSTAEPASLWLMSVRNGSLRRVDGTQGAGPPFWLPDSRSFAFVSGGKLFRAEVSGGSPVFLTNLAGTTQVGTWSRAGTMLLARSDGLFTVPEKGGTAVRLTTVDGRRGELLHNFPEFLPDGNRFLFFVASDDAATRGVYLGSLDQPNTRQQIVRSDSKGSYVPPKDDRPGVLLFVRGATLVAQPFDPGSARLNGDTRLVADGLALSATSGFLTGAAPFWSAPVGTLLYRVGTVSYEVNWVDRSGRRTPSGIPDGNYLDLRVSPENSRVAVSRPQQGHADLWHWDFGRTAWTRLTFNEPSANFPAWSPNGSQVVFSQRTSTGTTIARRSTDGSGEIEKLWQGPEAITVNDWGRDGRYILYSAVRSDSQTTFDVWLLPVAGPRTPIPLIPGPSSERQVRQAKFSPGVEATIAFTSNESGRDEVYVQALAEAPDHSLTVAGPRVAVSRTGGRTALWRGDGKELYFISSNNRMMAADIQAGAGSVSVGAVRELFSATFMTLNVLPYGVSSDGKRFLVLEPKNPALHPPFTVAVNWWDALDR